MLNPGFLVEGVLRGVLGVRPKRSRRALRYLTGSRGGGWLINPNTLLTAAGVVWGIFDTLNANQNQPGAGGSMGSMGSEGNRSVGSGGSAGSVGSIPPLPVQISDDALRIVRLAISAANADGAMNERERAAVIEQASASGGADLVSAEMQRPTPLAQIVSGVSDPAQRATLYVLAYTILRADEQITGAERIYLAQLANLLGLSPEDVQALEQSAAERIDSPGP
jgi:uncharacterized membrane protein YebE (DUF533 family)